MPWSPRKKPKSSNYDSSFNKIQSILRKRLTNFGFKEPLIGCDEQRRILYNLLQRTATANEGNSVLISGRRGSGKTSLVKNVLREILLNFNTSGDILVVNLNGFLQTDDKIAVKEITRQLQLENVVGDRVFGSIAENLKFLLESLKSGDSHTKCIYFILEEFDLFCGHHRQILLYNLFDISQSAKTSIAIVGITCHLDATGLLEKRVKSRFSHRQIFMNIDFTFDQYYDVFMKTLLVDSDDVEKSIKADWNKSIERLVTEPEVRSVVENVFNFTKDIGTLKTTLLMPCVSGLTPDRPHVQVEDIRKCYSQYFRQDAKRHMLNGVSVLELCLLLAAGRLAQKYDGDPFNFESVFTEYLAICAHHPYSKDVAAKAFDNLVRLELLQPVHKNNSNLQKSHRMMDLMLETSQIDDAIQTSPLVPTDIKHAATSAINPSC